MKTGTVALIVMFPSEGVEPVLVECLSDDFEIGTFELALNSDASRALEVLRAARQKRSLEDEEFGDYVENLLSQPFLPRLSGSMAFSGLSQKTGSRSTKLQNVRRAR